MITATLGEEGEIRQPDVATPETLASVRRGELACAVQTLGLAEHEVWDYRDSGMARSSSNAHPRAFVNAPATEVVERLVKEIRIFRPQVVLTFGPDGLYGHPDHIAVSKHVTEAHRLAAEPAAFSHQLSDGTLPHQARRLFHSVRPRGFRTQWALALRNAGVDFPLPSPEQETQGVSMEEIHLEMDVADQLEAKMACILCHRTQVGPDWPYHRVSREVAASILGREFYVRAYPPVQCGETVSPHFFQGLPPEA